MHHFDLPQVKENIAEETVTLIGRDVTIRIAFEGQVEALMRFRDVSFTALIQSEGGGVGKDGGGHRAGRGEGLDYEPEFDDGCPTAHPVRS